jgi:Co/Zn/Cd efflux system component
MRIFLELAIPSFSVVCLLAVTGYITAEAIFVLMLPEIPDDDVNINILYGFVAVNFVIDIICSYAFYSKGGKAIFYTADAVVSPTEEIAEAASTDEAVEESQVNLEVEDIESTSNVSGSTKALNVESKGKVNLNMLSAFTHLNSDTLRTLSVFVAALVATIAGVPGVTVDAWAAVVVAFTILVMVMPLMREIYKSALHLRMERVKL